MKKKVLLVDDNQEILDSLEFILEDEGYDVTSLTKGEEAYRFVKEQRPHVILLDILLSGSDGRTICKMLKSDTSTRSIPVVMMSAHPSAGQAANACGADSFLEKPFEVKTLLNTLIKYTT